MRWTLSFWCLFLLAAGVLAQGNARFVVLDTKTRHPLAGALIEFPETENIWRTESDGVALCGPLHPGKHHYRVRAIVDGIAYKIQEGHINIINNQTSEVIVNLRSDGEIVHIIDHSSRNLKGAVRFIVKDAKMGQRISGAPIYISDSPETWRTGQDGIVECVLKAGKTRYEARALVDGITYKPKSGLVSVRQERITEVEIELKPDKAIMIDDDFGKPVPKSWGTLDLIILDSVTKEPLKGAMILLAPVETDEAIQDWETNYQGRIGIAHKNGTYHYAVVAFVNGIFYERQRGEIMVTAGNKTKLTINLRPLKHLEPSMR